MSRSPNILQPLVGVWHCWAWCSLHDIWCRQCFCGAVCLSSVLCSGDGLVGLMVKVSASRADPLLRYTCVLLGHYATIKQPFCSGRWGGVGVVFRFVLLRLDFTIIIIAFCPYWSIGRLQEFSRHSNPGPASQVVPRCEPSSLFQPPGHGDRCFVGSLVFFFPMCSRSGFDVWCRLLPLEGVSNTSSASLEDFHLLLVVAWSVSRVLCCWWSQAIRSEGFCSGRWPPRWPSG